MVANPNLEDPDQNISQIFLVGNPNGSQTDRKCPSVSVNLQDNLKSSEQILINFLSKCAPQSKEQSVNQTGKQSG